MRWRIFFTALAFFTPMAIGAVGYMIGPVAAYLLLCSILAAVLAYTAPYWRDRV